MRMRMLALAAVLALAGAACGGDDDGGAQPTNTPTDSTAGNVVAATDGLAFNPKTITVKAGASVEWRNTGSLPHTVSFKNGSFDEQLPEGGKVSFTFTAAGKTDYVCKIHPTMTGTVVVE